jgi:class 3 adenylate cyclase
MVLILDDLQWADRASLLLLQFLGGQLRGCRILVVGTYRDSDVDSGHPLAEVLATLRRDSDHKRLPLRGLSMQEARALLEASAEHELGTREVRIAELMYERTEGNPFFIEEVIRHLVEAGQLSRRGGRWVIDVDTVEEVGIPEGVRETVGRRLARLSPECRELLSTAAVIGRQFELEQLQQITGSPPPTLLETLDEAVQARIIVELPDGLGRYAFVHGLTRETLYEQLPRARRVNTHLSVMSALESLHADSIEAHLPELAHHANQAILVGGPGKAVEYATRAAARAASMLAYEDAVTHYDAAVSALGPQGSAERRLELLMALGSACWSSGEYNRSRDAYRAAAELAKELGSSDQLALAALGYSGELYFETGQVNATKIALLESALEALGDEDSPLRVRVMSRLAEALTYAGDPERRDRLGQEAVAMARRIDDPSALAQALTVAYVASWSMDTLEERLRAATEAISLAEQAGDRAMAAQARALLTGSLLEHGDIDGAEREIRLLGRSADELGFSYYRWAMITAEAALLLLRGKFADVEEVAAKALAIGQATQNETAFQAYATQVSLQRLEQRQLGGLVDGATAIVEQYPALPVWRCGRALCCVEDGRAAEARAELDELAVDDFSLVRSNPYACLSLCFLAEVAARLSDADRAQTLYDLLAPYGDRLCVAQPFLSCHGSISRHLGLLATTLARYEQAAEHFEDAIATNARIDAPGWLAHCQVEYADTLLRHGETSERHKALELLSQALDIASELNMPGVIEQALALKMRSQGIESLPAGSSIDAVADSVELERPHLGQHAAPDGTVTLLFTDIENSTETTERLGDKRWLELLSDHNAIIHEETSAHGGFEVKSQGDGFMLAFPSASRALLCAVGIQRAIEAYTDSHPDSQLRVRIGLHTGEVIRTGDDFFGRHVILAARIAAAARGDEILVSELLKQLVEPSGEWQFADAQEVELKGLSGTHRLFSVEWQSEPAPVSG